MRSTYWPQDALQYITPLIMRWCFFMVKVPGYFCGTTTKWDQTQTKEIISSSLDISVNSVVVFFFSVK